MPFPFECLLFPAPLPPLMLLLFLLFLFIRFRLGFFFFSFLEFLLRSPNIRSLHFVSNSVFFSSCQYSSSCLPSCASLVLFKFATVLPRSFLPFLCRHLRLWWLLPLVLFKFTTLFPLSILAYVLLLVYLLHLLLFLCLFLLSLVSFTSVLHFSFSSSSVFEHLSFCFFYTISFSSYSSFPAYFSFPWGYSTSLFLFHSSYYTPIRCCFPPIPFISITCFSLFYAFCVFLSASSSCSSMHPRPPNLPLTLPSTALP